jgi:hypothetical protein
MRCGKSILFGAATLSVGYLLGATGALNPSAFAQPAEEAAATTSDEAENKIRAAQIALQEAMEQLRQDGNYNAITDGVNSFVVLSGGGDARRDLESGNGVDPETFAALYAGKAIPEIADMLGKDDEGRITYNEKPVQMYSRKRLERMFAERLRIKDAGL